MEKQKFALTDHIEGSDIKAIRTRMQLTQAEFAEFICVSKKTVERWEGGDKEITGPIVTLVKLLGERPQTAEELRIPPKMMPMRLWYMYKNSPCTLIDVDERIRDVKIRNFTTQYWMRAFGRETEPTFEQYEEFLESRCFPRSRDKMKLILRELDLPFYDPLMIIEKTNGRMAEDDFWIRIER